MEKLKESLTINEIEKPSIKPNDILVEVRCFR
jgi:NADPH:quinone reductase-like Zn-dependent oxidoreductase